MPKFPEDILKKWEEQEKQWKVDAIGWDQQQQQVVNIPMPPPKEIVPPLPGNPAGFFMNEFEQQKAEIELAKAQAKADAKVKVQVFAGGGFAIDHAVKKKKPLAPGGVHPGWKGSSESKKLIILDKVGADIELFLRDAKTNSPVPCVQLIGGTKEKPIAVINDEGYALQEDNVLLEFNIPACSTRHKFIYSVQRIKEEIVERAKELGCVPSIQASMRFEESQLQSEQAKIFGCEPDFNVWERRVNETASASNPEAKTLRTAGGHVHLGFTLANGEAPKMPENLAEIETVVMLMDIFLGVPFSLMDKDKDRQKLYGKAGAFRPKPYGVEYRVLSNHWIRAPELIEYVYQQVEGAVEYLNLHMGGFDQEYLRKYEGHVIRAINEGDSEQAGWLMDNFNIRLPNVTR